MFVCGCMWGRDDCGARDGHVTPRGPLARRAYTRAARHAYLRSPWRSPRHLRSSRAHCVCVCECVCVCVVTGRESTCICLGDRAAAALTATCQLLSFLLPCLRPGLVCCICTPTEVDEHKRRNNGKRHPPLLLGPASAVHSVLISSTQVVVDSKCN